MRQLVAAGQRTILDRCSQGRRSQGRREEETMAPKAPKAQAKKRKLSETSEVLAAHDVQSKKAGGGEPEPGHAVQSALVYDVPSTATYAVQSLSECDVPSTTGYAVPSTTGYASPSTQVLAVPSTSGYTVQTTSACGVPTEHAVQSKEVGGGEPAAGSSQPRCQEEINSPRSMTILFDKLQEGFIFADSFTDLPERVYFVKSGVEKRNVDPEQYFQMEYRFLREVSRNTVPDEFFMIPKRSSQTRQREDESLDERVALDIFEKMASGLYFSDEIRQWNVSKENDFAHYQFVKDMVMEFPLLGGIYRQGYVRRGFVNRMTNSSGKTALTAILDMACVVASGQQAVATSMIGTFQVGSSDKKQERFPVAQIPSSFYHKGKGSRVLNSSFPSVSSDNIFETASFPTSSAHITIPDTGVYADLLTVSCYKPNWPHFVFVGEIKSGRFSSTEEQIAKAQLVREMLGVLLVQNVVFGILINELEAWLCSMKLNFENKKIGVCFVKYSFVEADGQFSLNQFRVWFLDIVSALKDMEHVKKVCHWPLKGSN